MKTSENHGMPESENFSTKAEIDGHIETLSIERDSLAKNRDTLKGVLSDLLHSYTSAGESLEKFKVAESLLVERLENPTIPDRLMGSFRELIGNEPIKEKGDFLEWKPSANVSANYRKTGEELRNSVGDVGKNKDLLRELMGEDLSFRGGKTEGEEASAREASIGKISQKISNIQEEVSRLDDQIKQKRDESYESWKKENPEEWEKIQKRNKAEAAFEQLIASKPTDDELYEVFRGTSLQDIKERARSLLIESARAKGPRKVFDAFVYGGLYAPKHFDALTSAFSSKEFKYSEDTDNIASDNFDLLSRFLDIDERVVDFAISNLDVNNCSYFGNGDGCIRSSCVMVSRYWNLPVSIQEKIVEKLERGGKKNLSALFPDVIAAKIDDPLKKAEFILSLSKSSRRYSYDSYQENYLAGDAISPNELREAALIYLNSGKQDEKLLSKAVSALDGDKDKEVIKKLLSNLSVSQIKSGFFEKIKKIRIKTPSRFDYSDFVNEDVIKKYLSKFTINSSTETEAKAEADRILGITLETLGGSFSKMVNDHLKGEVKKVQDKEKDRKSRIKDIV